MTMGTLKSQLSLQVQLIWSRFSKAQVNLFALQESSHCRLWYSLTEALFCTNGLAHSWPKGLCKYVFPQVSLIAQMLFKGQGGRRTGPAGRTLLAHKHLLLGAHAPLDGPSLVNCPPSLYFC